MKKSILFTVIIVSVVYWPTVKVDGSCFGCPKESSIKEAVTEFFEDLRTIYGNENEDDRSNIFSSVDDLKTIKEEAENVFNTNFKPKIEEFTSQKSGITRKLFIAYHKYRTQLLDQGIKDDEIPLLKDVEDLFTSTTKNYINEYINVIKDAIEEFFQNLATIYPIKSAKDIENFGSSNLREIKTTGLKKLVPYFLRASEMDEVRAMSTNFKNMQEEAKKIFDTKFKSKIKESISANSDLSHKMFIAYHKYRIQLSDQGIPKAEIPLLKVVEDPFTWMTKDYINKYIAVIKVAIENFFHDLGMIYEISCEEYLKNFRSSTNFENMYEKANEIFDTMFKAKNEKSTPAESGLPTKLFIVYHKYRTQLLDQGYTEAEIPLLRVVEDLSNYTMKKDVDKYFNVIKDTTEKFFRNLLTIYKIESTKDIEIFHSSKEIQPETITKEGTIRCSKLSSDMPSVRVFSTCFKMMKEKTNEIFTTTFESKVVESVSVDSDPSRQMFIAYYKYRKHLLDQGTSLEYNYLKALASVLPLLTVVDDIFDKNSKQYTGPYINIIEVAVDQFFQHLSDIHKMGNVEDSQKLVSNPCIVPATEKQLFEVFNTNLRNIKEKTEKIFNATFEAKIMESTSIDSNLSCRTFIAYHEYRKQLLDQEILDSDIPLVGVLEDIFYKNLDKYMGQCINIVQKGVDEFFQNLLTIYNMENTTETTRFRTKDFNEVGYRLPVRETETLSFVMFRRNINRLDDVAEVVFRVTFKSKIEESASIDPDSSCRMFIAFHKYRKQLLDQGILASDTSLLRILASDIPLLNIMENIFEKDLGKCIGQYVNIITAVVHQFFQHSFDIYKIKSTEQDQQLLSSTCTMPEKKEELFTKFSTNLKKIEEEAEKIFNATLEPKIRDRESVSSDSDPSHRMFIAYDMYKKQLLDQEIPAYDIPLLSVMRDIFDKNLENYIGQYMNNIKDAVNQFFESLNKIYKIKSGETFTMHVISQFTTLKTEKQSSEVLIRTNLKNIQVEAEKTFTLLFYSEMKARKDLASMMFIAYHEYRKQLLNQGIPASEIPLLTVVEDIIDNDLENHIEKKRMLMFKIEDLFEKFDRILRKPLLEKRTAIKFLQCIKEEGHDPEAEQIPKFEDNSGEADETLKRCAVKIYNEAYVGTYDIFKDENFKTVFYTKQKNDICDAYSKYSSKYKDGEMWLYRQVIPFIQETQTVPCPENHKPNLSRHLNDF